MARRITDSAFASRPKASRRVVERRGAAGTDGDSCTGTAADGPGAQHGASRSRSGHFGQSRLADRQALSGGRIAAGHLRRASSGPKDAAGRGTWPAHHCHGVRAAASGTCALDGAADRRGGGEAQTRRAGKSGDGPHPASEPRSEAVAGKRSRRRGGIFSSPRPRTRRRSSPIIWWA